MTNVEAIVKKCSPEDQVALNEWVSFTADKVRENNHLKQKLAATAHELRVLKRLHYAATSEKISVPIYSQEILPLFNDFELVADQVDSGNAAAEAPDAESEEKAALPREKSSEDAQQRGRKPLPKNLPRTIVEHDLPDAEKTCQCGEALTCFGVTTCEQLRYQPARFEVIEHRCKKYGCTACNAKNKIDSDTSAVIRTATKPLSILPKSIATPELLTQVLLNKFSDALPLYRQEAIFSRAGIDLSRQTLSNWILRVSKQVIPLVNLLQEWIVETSIAFADETPLQVLHEPNRRPQNTSYMWCFIGRQSDRTAIVYQYHPSRSGQIPRDFFEARQQHAKPILNQLNAFIKEKKSSVLPQSPLGKAIDYALKRWHYLTTYLQDGRYEIDNNRAERAIKPFVIGRKNWLFSNTPSGAHSTARLYTLIETVKANGIQPERYLNHLFKELPYCSTLNDYENLLPWNLKPKLNSS